MGSRTKLCWAEKNIMSALLMTIVNSHGSISSNSNMKFFKNFMNFKTLSKGCLIEKSFAVQTDWGGEYRNLNSFFFEKIGISYHVSCPHAHQHNRSAECKHRHIVEVDSCSLLMRPCLWNSGTRHFLLPHILLIEPLAESSSINLL